MLGQILEIDVDPQLPTFVSDGLTLTRGHVAGDPDSPAWMARCPAALGRVPGQVQAILPPGCLDGVCQRLLFTVPDGSVLYRHEILHLLQPWLRSGEGVLCLHQKSSGAVVYRYAPELEFLLVCSQKHRHWGIPKGNMEPGELEDETARREVFEETGQRIDLMPPFREVIAFRMDDLPRYKQVAFFLAQGRPTPLVRNPEEHCDIAWVPWQQALERIPFPKDRGVLERAVQRLGRVSQPAAVNQT